MLQVPSDDLRVEEKRILHLYVPLNWSNSRYKALIKNMPY